jgi:hypothetical protein
MHRLLASRHVDTFVASAVMTAGILAVLIVVVGFVVGLAAVVRLVEGWM